MLSFIRQICHIFLFVRYPVAIFALVNVFTHRCHIPTATTPLFRLVTLLGEEGYDGGAATSCLRVS